MSIEVHPRIRGEHHGSCEVVIRFNSQAESLPAPGGKIYLPCDTCGRVCAVPPTTVSFQCSVCPDEDAMWCEGCGRVIRAHEEYHEERDNAAGLRYLFCDRC